MRILLATPLYPPDVGPPAPYVKELAERLSRKHQITVAAYGHLPEKVEGVSIITESKSRPLPMRLLGYTVALWRASRSADVIYAQNGPSVELPASIVALITGRPLVLCLGDASAHEQAKKNTYLKIIEGLARRVARDTITDIPLPRPEILPFEPMPDAQLSAYEASWDTHIESLEDIFNTAYGD